MANYICRQSALYHDLQTEVLQMPGSKMTWQGSDVDGADLRYELQTGLVELRGCIISVD